MQAAAQMTNDVDENNDTAEQSRMDKLAMAKKKLKRFQAKKAASTVTVATVATPITDDNPEPEGTLSDQSADELVEETTPKQSPPKNVADTIAHANVERYTDEINTMRALLLTERQQFAEQSKDYQKVISRLRSQVSAPPPPSNTAELANLKQTVSELETALTQRQDEKNVMEDKLKSFKDELQKSFDSTHALEMDKATLLAENATLQRTLKDSNTSRNNVEEMRMLMQSKEQIIASLNAETDKLHKSGEEMRTLLKAKEDAITQATIDVKHSQEADKQLAQLRVELDSQLDENSRMKNALKIHGNEQEEALTLVSSERDSLKQEIIALKQSQDTLNNELASEREKLTSLQSEKDQQVTSHVTGIAKLKAAADAAIRLVQARLFEEKKRVDALSKQLEQSKSIVVSPSVDTVDAKKYRDALDTLETDRKSHQDVKIVRDSLQKQLQDLNADKSSQEIIFEETHLKLVDALAAQEAVALKEAEVRASLEQAQLEILRLKASHEENVTYSHTQITTIVSQMCESLSVFGIVIDQSEPIKVVLEKMLQSISAEMLRMQKSTEAMAEEISRLQSSLDLLGEDTIPAIQDSLQKAQSANTTLEKRLADSESALREALTNCALQKDSFQNTLSINASESEQFRSAFTSLTDFTREIKTNEQSNLDQWTTDSGVGSVASYIKELKAELKHTQETAVERARDCDRLTEELGHLKKSHHESVELLQSELQSITNAKAAVDDEILVLNKKIDDMAGTMSSNSDEIISLEQKLHAVEAARDKALHDFEFTKSQLEEITKVKTQLGSELDAVKKTPGVNQTEVNELHSKINGLETEKLDLQSRLEASYRKLQVFENTAIAATDRLSEMVSLNEQQVRDIESAKSQLRSLVADAHAAKAELNKTQSFLDEIQGTKEEYNGVIASLMDLEFQIQYMSGESTSASDLPVQDMVRVMNERVFTAKESLSGLATLRKEHEALKAKTATREAEFSQSSTQLTELVAEKKVLQDQITNMSNALRDMTSQWKAACQANKDLVSQMESLKMSHAKEKDSMKAEIDDGHLQAAKNPAMQKMDREYTLSQERVARLQSEIDQTANDMSKERERYASSIDMMEHMLADEKENVSSLAHELKLSKAAVIMNPTSFADIDKLKNQNKELEEVASSATEQAEQAFESLEKANALIATLKVSLASEGARLEVVKLNLNALMDSFPGAQVPIREFKNIEELAGALADSMSELVSKARRLENDKDNADRATKDVSDKLSRQSKENGELREQVEEILHKVEYLHTQLNEAKWQQQLNDTSIALVSPTEPPTADKSLDDAYENLKSSSLQIDELTRALADALQKYDTDIDARNEIISKLQSELESLRNLKDKLPPFVEIVDYTVDFDAPDDRLVEQETELERLRYMCDERQELVNEMQTQLADNERSITQAEKTISVLNEELDRRFNEINAIKIERDLLKAQSVSNSSSELGREKTNMSSPTHTVIDSRMESTFKDTSDVVQSIDQLLKMSFSKHSSVAVETAVDPRLDKCAQLIGDVLAGVKDLKVAAASNNTSQLHTIVSYLDQISRLLGELQSVQSLKGEDVMFQTLLSERDNEVQILKKSLQSIAVSSLSGSPEAVQDRVNQLRKAWDHEIYSNDVLRQLLSEVRSRYVDSEREYVRNIENLRSELASVSFRSSPQKINVNLEALQLRENQLIAEKDQKNASIRALQNELISIQKLREDSMRIHDVERIALENSRATAANEVASLKRQLALHEQVPVREESWKSEKQTIMRELDLLKRNERVINERLDAALAEKRALEHVLSDNMSKWTQQKNKWTDDYNALKRRGREEKEALLSRFKSKIAEYESVFREQTETMEQLRRIQHASNGHDYRNTHDNAILQQEIAALRAQQRVLSDNLVQERATVYAHMKQYEHTVSQSTAFSHSHNSANDNLQREREKHRQHCHVLVTDLAIVKLKYRREAGYRADLMYQKDYLLMLAGRNVFDSNVLGYRSPTQNLKKAVIVVMAMCRMRLLAKQWRTKQVEIKSNCSHKVDETLDSRQSKTENHRSTTMKARHF